MKVTSFSIVLLSSALVTLASAQMNIEVLHRQNSQESDAWDNTNGLAEPGPSSFAQHSTVNGLKGTGSSGQQVVEGPINPNTYVVGPGDELCVSLWGTVNQTMLLLVNGEGMLLVPSVGVVEVRGLTLTQGKEKIKGVLSKVFKKTEITVSISRLRVFRCYVAGEVKKPGAYLVTAQTRASDLIEMAGGLINETAGRIRGIEVANDSFPARSADMAQFLHGAVMDKNPYLLQGDRVIVRPRKEIVQINGKIGYPGIYDFVSGDRLCDVLSAAGGVSRGVDSSKIILTRFLNNRDSLKEYSLSMSDSLFTINADDRILVCGIPEYRLHSEVYLEGEVQRPGVYPIQKDRTTLRDLIEMSGGFTEFADLNYSKVVRQLGRNTNEKIVTWLKSFSTGDLFAIERSYLKSQILEDGGEASLNFAKIKDKAGDFVLQDGDRILIAKISLAVRVSGAVKFPGIVGYEKGKDYRYYIEKAGGFSSTARRGNVKLMKNDVATLLKPDDTMVINPGDMIWVPENDNRQAMKNTIDILTIVASAVTIIVSVIAISKR